MASTVPRVILGSGVGFSEWETDVQAALAEKKRLGKQGIKVHGCIVCPKGCIDCNFPGFTGEGIN